MPCTGQAYVWHLPEGLGLGIWQPAYAMLTHAAANLPVPENVGVVWGGLPDRGADRTTGHRDDGCAHAPATVPDIPKRRRFATPTCSD
ncbi:hypothetical protein HYE82_16500 [Streptomyces sp. BR123]|uniref:hypothetical protein n=1 Tax=Streptomyces sp. BR123 TaxID=2749828 RepID=UPI0015C4BA18|nr:hypothetical protein [Streptomyces sp. BR123]NXY95961.1 hypothetical protein [Streptomyces sp. BR123]